MNLATYTQEERDSPAPRGSLAKWLPLLADLPSCQQLWGHLAEQPTEPLRVAPLVEAPRPALVALLQAQVKRPILLITPGPEVARRLYDSLRIYLANPEDVLFYPASDARPYERMAPDSAIVAHRLSVLEALTRHQEGVPLLLVAAARALVQPTLSPAEFAHAHQKIHRGMIFPMEEMIQRWVEWGYRPARMVEEPGEFARRGGIVDVYPPTTPLPLRIELFGDEVDSIRQFDPVSQRSQQQLASFSVITPYEVPWWRRKYVAGYLGQMDVDALRPEIANELTRDREYLEQGTYFEGIHLYASVFQTKPACLLDHLPQDTLIVLEEPEQIQAAVEEIADRTANVHFELVQGGELSPSFPEPYLGWEAIQGRLSRNTQIGLSVARPAEETVSTIDLPFAPLPHYGGRLKEVLACIKESRERDDRIVVVSHQAARLRKLLQERDTFPASDRLELVTGRLPSGGWSCPEANLTLLSDTEIFGWAPPRRRPLVRRPRREFFREDLLQRLQVGDYVVHEDHGFAIYEGLIQLTLADGIEREYLHLRYAGTDRLYVPVDRVDRVRRYVGGGRERPPALHRLGTGAWERTKDRVRRAVEDMAEELLNLHAARELAQGHAFSPDQPWQAELEAAFPYIETQDQLRVMEEVKQDMEQPRPMDRLVCGDVGYGKTEVALRAAFKAVLDGKQVAVLVPTTVLAQQHYRTFSERLEPFPVRVEMLSRFRSRGKQKEIVENLGQGGVDIVIGTHRLLSKDVAFQDVGLVVVDEEQRFGVRHKEHLKQLRREVDVLTLTATPIPRTLHMGLSGLRDLSVIETPPEERVPIRTYVVPRDDKVIRGAILRELERGGQVYFVHNRVRSIYRICQELIDLVPEARFAVGHGQLPERELERVMLEFVEGKHDVLVCTTIIESGLDIPNVNTILIDNAISLGLAQLYQLRGRVGRGAMRAYAYLLYRPRRRMSDAAQKRLQAILEATDLGAGFQIAMRDLEIRGAGNLLGAQQSGHIAAVGFDLYTRLLAGTVEELREAKGRPGPFDKEEWRKTREELRGPAPIILDLPLKAYLPDSYVAEPEVRLQVYRRMGDLRSTGQVKEMARELRDRFGELPTEAQTLLDLLQLKILALRAGVREIRAENGRIVIIFPEGARPSPGELPDWVERRLQVRTNLVWLDLQGLGNRWPDVLRRILLALVPADEG